MTIVGPDGYLEGFIREPGRNAGRRAGSVTAFMVRHHFTVGRCAGDRAIGARGYFTLYAPRSPSCGRGRVQFAEWYSTCFDACEWNPWGFSVEYERLSFAERLTDYQLETGAIVIAAARELGIPDDFYDRPDARFPVGTPVRGHVNHRSLHERKCDEHYDGLLLEEFAAMLQRAGGIGPSPAPGPTPTRRHRRRTMTVIDGKNINRNYRIRGGEVIEAAIGHDSGKLVPMGEFRVSANADASRATELDAQPTAGGVLVTFPVVGGKVGMRELTAFGWGQTVTVPA